MMTLFLLQNIANIGCSYGGVLNNDKLQNLSKSQNAFLILYSNDTTNIEANVSPYHKKGEPFSEEMLRASVDETAGLNGVSGKVGVHILQPGLCWVPWWKSKVYPADEHYKWFLGKTGLPIDSISEYVLKGGDVVKVFVDQCRKRNITPFISLRLNDCQGVEYEDILLDILDSKKTAVKSDNKKHNFNALFTSSLSRFQLEHPEYRLEKDPQDYRKLSKADRIEYILSSSRRYNLRRARIQNWAIPDVRDYKFAFIKEICENYDIDGFELDFMRYPKFFKSDMPAQMRIEIMKNFVSAVRSLLDRTAKPGQKRWLCVRVPARLSAHAPLGISLEKFVDAGVDMVNLSSHFFSAQQTDLDKICQLIPNSSVYLEMTCTNTLDRDGSKKDLYRMMTAQQFYTGAHLAYARGAKGVSLFNFAYYRSLPSTPTEPPFQIFTYLGDPQWLSTQPQHYFLVPDLNPMLSLEPDFSKNEISFNAPLILNIDMAPLKGVGTTDALLWFETEINYFNNYFLVFFNGIKLKPFDKATDTYPISKLSELSSPETPTVNWKIPKGLIKDGVNKIMIQMKEKNAVKLKIINIVISAD